MKIMRKVANWKARDMIIYRNIGLRAAKVCMKIYFADNIIPKLITLRWAILMEKSGSKKGQK